MLWVTTPSGKKWSLMQPRSEDVVVSDIAHNLAYQVRFNGSCGQYTVAEHSCHVHDEAVRQNLPPEWCFLALLHDAHEAYIGDITTPVTCALDLLLVEAGVTLNDRSLNQVLTLLKTRTDRAIFEALGLDHFSLPGKAYHTVRTLDATALRVEREALFPAALADPQSTYSDASQASFHPACWSAHKARQYFLDRIARYTSDSFSKKFSLHTAR